jgi:hypothetical protein
MAFSRANQARLKVFPPASRHGRGNRNRAIARLEDAMNAYEIRRRPDGSLDFDFYRRRAVRLRRQAMRDALKAKAVALAKVLVAAAILAVTVCLVPSADGTGWNGKTSSDARAVVARPAITAGKS